MQLASTRFT